MTPRGRALVIILPLALILAGGAGAYFFWFQKRDPGAPEPDKTHLLALEDISVNLADDDRPHYLTVSVSFMLVGPDPEQAAAERDAQIRDAVIMTLTRHTYESLLVEEGKQALKEDLAAAVSEAVASEKVELTDVLFTTFIME